MGDGEATETGRAISKLDERTIQQIAAGEVVERPASVVKELLENSIDAAASQVAVRAAGEDLTEEIVVEDNGHGIEPDALKLAVESHTTSKIASHEDLFEGPPALGFRGEALHAISQVSRLEIRSRPPDTDLGRELVVHGGDFVRDEPTGTAPGTIVTVKDLFGPTPARRKFLDAPATERRHFQRTVAELATAHPSVAVELTIDDRERFVTPGDGSIRSCVGAIYGSSVAASMIELDEFSPDNRSQVEIHGVVSDPETTRSSATKMTTIVNGRPIDNTELNRAIIRGYGDRLGPDRYPIVVIDIAIDPRTLDVNVHPRKRAVTFDEPGTVAGIVESTVQEALEATAATPTGPPRRSGHDHSEPSRGPRPAIDLGNVSYAGAQTTLPGMDEEAAEASYSRLPSMHVIGQAMDAYIIAETSSGGLVIIDQHAADERINYERLRDRVRESEQHQQLAEPLRVSLTPAEADHISGARDEFEAAGFRFTRQDETTVRITGVPAILDKSLPTEAISSLVEELVTSTVSGTPDISQSTIIESILSDLACHPAITANEPLPAGQIETLLRRLDDCASPWTCPHGRPTIIELTQDELDERFERDYPGVGPCRRWHIE